LYAIGRWGGRAVLLRHGHLFRMSEQDLDRADDWFDRHGPKVVFFARMIPLARSIVSVPAGTSEMPILRFLLLTAAGSALWNALLIGLGVAFGENYQRVADTVSRVSDGVVIVLGVALVAVAVWWFRRRQTRRVNARSG
jgi:membrane protein DedA with SNARE-associated domain